MKVVARKYITIVKTTDAYREKHNGQPHIWYRGVTKDSDSEWMKENAKDMEHVLLAQRAHGQAGEMIGFLLYTIETLLKANETPTDGSKSYVRGMIDMLRTTVDETKEMDAYTSMYVDELVMWFDGL